MGIVTIRAELVPTSDVHAKMLSTIKTATWVLGLGLFLSVAPAEQDVTDTRKAAAELEEAFQAQGVALNVAAGRCVIPAEICIREDLLEYVLVAATGAAHESLFATGVSPTVLNAALVTLGAKKGQNVRWIEKDPMPSEEEIRNGAQTYDVLPPTGKGFLIYAAWKEGEETYFFRLEDLITNLARGRSMKRHQWVYLGSRLVQPEPDSEELVLAAELEGNLINLSYFRTGNTIFTAALEDCIHQTIWVPNAPLLPERGAAVSLIFSTDPLASLPEEFAQRLVDIGGR